MPDNSCHMICALKSVPGLADVGVLQEDGDGPRTPPRCLERSGKSLKWLILLIVSPSTIDKMFEIFGPIFEEIANFGRIFEKSVNLEHFVNGRWTHY